MPIEDTIDAAINRTKETLGELVNSDRIKEEKNSRLIGEIFRNEIHALNGDFKENINSAIRIIRARDEATQKRLRKLKEAIRRHDLSASSVNESFIAQFGTASDIEKYMRVKEDNQRWLRIRAHIRNTLGISIGFSLVESFLETHTANAGTAGLMPFTAYQTFMLLCILGGSGIIYNEYIRRPRVIRSIMFEIEILLNRETLIALKQKLFYTTIINSLENVLEELIQTQYHTAPISSRQAVATATIARVYFLRQRNKSIQDYDSQDENKQNKRCDPDSCKKGLNL